MICYPWTVGHATPGPSIDDPLRRWFDAMSARPAVQRGIAVTAGPAEDPATLSDEERPAPPSSTTSAPSSRPVDPPAPGA
jgi:GST-like protein